MKQKRSTRDIYLAAAWMSMGAQFERVDRTDPKHQVFYFSSYLISIDDGDEGPEMHPLSVDLDKVEKDWVNQSLSGNLYEFSKAIQRMKAIIHSY